MHPPIRVFVYGTLKTGEPNHGVMAETAGQHKLEGKGRTINSFPLIIASQYNIPCLLLERGTGHRVHGEVYTVDEEKLKILDELEAYPKLYTRELEEIELDDGSKTTAWIYMIPKWREDIFKESTGLLENYSSEGPHGREYVDRYVRAKDMLDEEFNLFAWLLGLSSEDNLSLEASKAKARADLQAQS